jgi:hypothetical protein
MNLELFEIGMRWWLQNKPRWGLLHSFYEKLYATRPDHLNEDWWRSRVDTLADWRAIRSRTPPNTKQQIFTRGLARLEAMDKHYRRIRNRAGDQEPSFENTPWEDLEPLFDVLCQVKGGKSPVLASKLGHFIFPRLFIVIDNEATAVFPYEVMWCGLQVAWQNFQEKARAKEMLATEIRKHSSTIHAEYPFETKIAEMWLIGYKQR